MVKLIDRCLELDHTVTYSTPLCALLKYTISYPFLIQKIVVKALLEWPAPAIYELGQSIWRFKVIPSNARVDTEYSVLGEREIAFWSERLREAEQAENSRVMKETLYGLSELCRRRSP